MNWRLIFLLSLFGIVMGSASLGGLTQGIEWLLWLIIALFCAFILSRKLQAKHFPSGLLVGVLATIYNALIQAGFFNTYSSNNPAAAEGLN